MREFKPALRLKILLWILLVWSGAIVVRLLILQIGQRPELLRIAEHQQQRTVEQPALRGAILDRAGQPLAKTLIDQSILVNPMKIPDAKVAASILAPLLELDRAALLAKINDAKVHHRGFLWVKRNVSVETAHRLHTLNLDWVESRQEMRRSYPQGNLAPHVIGTVGTVDSAMLEKQDSLQRGTSGLELVLDDELAGRSGESRVYTDVLQRAYQTDVLRAPVPGTNIRSTIDSNLQYEAQEALAAAAKSSGASQGTLVAMDPANGQILAMVSYPWFDPTQIEHHGGVIPGWTNVAVSTPFEPGSVFKVITLASALETTSLTPDSMVNGNNGSITLFGMRIRDHASYGMISMADVLAKSSNVGAVQIGTQVGATRLYEYIRRFGFGSKTGVDLPSESSGMVRRLSRWQPASIGYVSMGHEISITSLQMAIAGAAVANGGLRVKPQLVLARQKPGSPEQRFEPEPGVRVINPETAIKMRLMMEGVVRYGTGKQATLKGYTAGGKTGSAQIFDFSSKSYTHHYNASFLGFAPVANPQIVIAVTLIGTQIGEAGFGGAVAAPVFRQVASSALRILDVPKDPALLDASNKNGKAGKAAKAAADTSLNDVADVPPSPLEVGRVELASAAQGGPEDGFVVPDFRGKTMRAVLEESAARGLTIDFIGGGIARSQEPAPGTVAAVSSHIKILFSR